MSDSVVASATAPAIASATAIVHSNTCGCHPDYVYSSGSSFRGHFSSQRHHYWETFKENRGLRTRILELENQLSMQRVETARLYEEVKVWKSMSMRVKKEEKLD